VVSWLTGIFLEKATKKLSPPSISSGFLFVSGYRAETQIVSVFPSKEKF
jgi:hypothetical protein